MNLRRMSEGDAEAVARLCGQLGYPTSANEVAARFRAMGVDAEHCVYVADDPAAGVIGWIHVLSARHLQANPSAQIGGLVVDAEFRGRGVGRALMQAAERWALEQGLSQVQLRSRTARTDAHRFYQELGYEIVKTSYMFRKELEA